MLLEINRPSTSAFQVHRIKGRIVRTDGSVMMLQGVREVFELVDGGIEDGGKEVVESRMGKIVVIGRGLNGRAWQESLDAAITKLEQ